MILGKINVSMSDYNGNKENFDALYIDAEKLLDSETRLSTATTVDSYGRALCSLSKDSFYDTTVKFDLSIDSETATISINPENEVIGNLNLRVGDKVGSDIVSHYWKYIGTNANVTDLFISDTQVAFLTQLQNFGNGYCDLFEGKLGDGLAYEGLAKLKDYKLSINEIIGTEGD